MMMPQQYCLRWKHHHTNVQNMFAQLLEKERFCDVTLYCSPSFATQVPNKDTVEPQNIRGVSLRAHRVVLAACSELLGALLGAHEAHGEPVLVIDGAEPRHLRALLDYMYTGEMNVHHSQLASLLKTAEELRIKGLTDIRWNNKDEPPDSEAGVITTTHTDTRLPEKHPEAKHPPKHASPKHTSPKHASPKHASPMHTSPKDTSPKRTPEPEPRTFKIEDSDYDVKQEKINVNGGPPPLIKLPLKDKLSPVKRENSDSDSPSPKRQRLASGTEHTDDDSVSVTKSERDQEWQHGNLDISAERVVGWGMAGGVDASRGSSRDVSDDEWADAPADIGSFLHTRLRVDGDNSADEESNDSGGCAARGGAAASSSSSASATALELHAEATKAQLQQYTRPTVGPKSGPTDSRFTDVVKLSEYLQHGRRPQFWEENYVKRVMEAVRLKELEMKQAAEILGVSYGTLYGRYRDVYGCINRPYRAVRDYWQAKAPAEVLERLQRGEVTLDAAAQALGVSIANLAAHVADFGVPEKAVVARPVLERLQRGELSLDAAARALGVNAANVAAHVADFGAQEKDFEPIPIEIDPSLKNRSRTYSATAAPPPAPPTNKPRKTTQDKLIKKIMVGSITDEDPIPATVITTHDVKPPAAAAAASGKWPTIRVASLDTLRETPAPAAPPPGGGGGGGLAPPAPPASPSQLMRTRPDLTIVAARRPPTDKKDEDLPT